MNCCPSSASSNWNKSFAASSLSSISLFFASFLDFFLSIAAFFHFLPNFIASLALLIGSTIFLSYSVSFTLVLIFTTFLTFLTLGLGGALAFFFSSNIFSNSLILSLLLICSSVILSSAYISLANFTKSCLLYSLTIYLEELPFFLDFLALTKLFFKV